MQGCRFRLQFRRRPTKSNNFTYQRKSSVATCARLSARFHSRVSGLCLPSTIGAAVTLSLSPARQASWDTAQVYRS
ncbi:hypothetical protein V8C43DRAFT_267636 [Trichoderma afarasin]